MAPRSHRGTNTKANGYSIFLYSVRDLIGPLVPTSLFWIASLKVQSLHTKLIFA